MLQQQQIEQYQRDGYLLLRDQIDDAELVQFEKAFQRHLPTDDVIGSGSYPAPGRYTLARSCAADPDLAFIIEHPNVTTPAAQLLNDEIVLTAFVVYDRTPGGPGLGAHHDYKRWRPVGSSMNWLFTIIPLSDFDETAGPLYIAPGSHRPERVKNIGERTLHVEPAVKPHPDQFIDPQLKRGDLLLMNMHLWHKAPGNNSDRHRIGIFNKYAARGALPATGYYVFNDGVYQALSDDGKKFIAVHSDKPFVATRLLLERQGSGGPEYLFTQENDRLTLPGGMPSPEQAIPDWDAGNLIASLHTHTREQLRIETPWVSYVGDFAEAEGLARVYAYPLNSNGFPVAYEPDGQWLSAEQARERSNDAMLTYGYELDAIERWADPIPVRGKGLTQAQSRIDQFAY